MSTPHVAEGTAVITGASSGLGEIFADRLAKLGRPLVLVARRQEELDRVAAECREHGVEVETLAADLTDTSDLRRACDRAAKDDVGVLVNNAGFGKYLPFAELDESVIDGMMAINIVAVTKLARAALPGMIERNRGDIINLSSGLSLSRMPTRSVYAAAKAYVNALTEILAAETKDTGVRVQALCPTITRTPFHDRSGTDLEKVPAHLIAEPGPIVDASLAALSMGETICVPVLQDHAVLERTLAVQGELAKAIMQTNTPAPRYRL